MWLLFRCIAHVPRVFRDCRSMGGLLLACACGCNSELGQSRTGGDGSIYGKTSYPVRAVLVYKDQKPVPLESLSIYAGPKSVIRKILVPTIQEYEQELEDLQEQRRQMNAAIDKQKTSLRDTETEIAEEYEKRRPQGSERDFAKSRNPLKELTKVRAVKSKADEWYQGVILERVDPIKAEIASLQGQSNALAARYERTQAGFNDRIFRALDDFTSKQKKQWKTKSDGLATIDIPNDEPWTVWSVATHAKATGIIRERRAEYRMSTGGGVSENSTEVEREVSQDNLVRWMLDIPDDLIGGQLHLDLETAFDFQNVDVVSDGDNGPYLKVRGR